MAKAKRPIRVTTGAEFKAARLALGIDKTELARWLRLSDPRGSGRESVRRYETDANKVHGIPGPVQLAMEAFLSGWRPAA